MLQKMLQVLVVEDIPGKLVELLDESPKTDTSDTVMGLIRKGYSPEAIAGHINGTYHTAYINDLRLSRSIVSAMYEFDPYLVDEHAGRKAAFRRFKEVFRTLMNSKVKLEPQQFMALLETNPSESVEILKKLLDPETGDLEIELISETEFKRRIGGNAAMESCDTIYYSKSGRADQKNKIVMKEMPPLDLSTQTGVEAAFREVLVRVVGLLHEGVQHHRQTTGKHEAILKGEAPFNFLPGHIGRSERLGSEIMAFLEEELWHARNYSIQKWFIARRLGENLPLHFRNMNEHFYFGNGNWRLVAEVREDF
jgi:hypothetical protein